MKKLIFLLSFLCLANQIIAQTATEILVNSIPEYQHDSFEAISDYHSLKNLPPDSIKISHKDYLTIYQDSTFKLNWEISPVTRQPLSGKSLSSKDDYYLGKIKTCDNHTFLFIQQIERGFRLSFSRIVVNIYNKDYILTNQIIVAENWGLGAPMEGSKSRTLKSFLTEKSIIFKWVITRNTANSTDSRQASYYKKELEFCQILEMNRKEIDKNFITGFKGAWSQTEKTYRLKFFSEK